VLISAPALLSFVGLIVWLVIPAKPESCTLRGRLRRERTAAASRNPPALRPYGR